MEKMKVRTILTKPAFQGIFASVYGTLKIESSGFLAGENIQKRTRQEFIAEIAQASQNVKRTPASVEMNDKEERRITYVLNGVIGGFHSHFMCSGEGLSDEDVDVIREHYPKGIEILITLDETGKLTPLKITPFSVSGTFSDKNKKYRMGMYAYYLDFGENGEEGRKKRAEIVIPRRFLRQYF